jgi:glyoxylase-like metal-dependent hydrolase (beta-lactamase superfamily II)
MSEDEPWFVFADSLCSNAHIRDRREPFMKRAAVVFLLISITTLVYSQSSPRTASVVERGMKRSDFPQMKKLMENIYTFSDLHTGGLGYLTNDMIVITTDGVLVADGQGNPEVTAQLVAAIKKVTNQPIKYVVICSDHGDHTGGNAAFPTTATFISSIASKKTLEDQAAAAREGATKIIVPTETVGDKRIIKLGTTEIQILNNGRAHTGGDMAVYLPKERVTFLSEVYSNHVFPSMRTAYPTEWVTTLRNVAKIDADIFIPGHGFVDDPQILKEELTEFSKAMTYVVAESTRLYKTGVPVDVALKQANWGPYETWTSRDRNAAIAMQRVYDELNGKLK